MLLRPLTPYICVWKWKTVIQHNMHVQSINQVSNLAVKQVSQQRTQESASLLKTQQ